MKKYSILALGLAALTGMPALAGNGAPSGAHYTLNIIGVPKDKTATMDDSNRRVIFVRLGASGASVSTRILLAEGEFKVLDGNGTDGTAQFQLPASNIDCPVDAPPDDPCQDSGDYSVFIRALGKPGGSAVITTCFEEAGIEYCSTESVTVERSKGKSTFRNVTKELTTVCLDTDDPPDGICDVREQLFSREFAEYYWDYDNSGLKLAQLRFYDNP